MIKVRKEGNDLLVSLFQVNKLNTLFTEMVEKQLSQLLEEDTRKIYFNLEKINFIDSSGFTMLTGINCKAEESGKEFILCNITDEVEELINLLQIGNKLKFGHKQFQSESLMLELEVD